MTSQGHMAVTEPSTAWSSDPGFALGTALLSTQRELKGLGIISRSDIFWFCDLGQVI